VVYQTRVEARKGLIFKILNIFIQVVRPLSLYSGIRERKFPSSSLVKNNIAEQKQDNINSHIISQSSIRFELE
jgi:hypothetical protein